MICFTLLCVAASALAFVNPTISSDAQYLTPNADDSNLLPNELNVANLVVEDIPADSSAIRCTSDVLEDPSDNIKTRRSIGICPTLNNDHDTVQPSGTKSPTTTQQNPCTKEYYSHWVSCGGEELFYKYPKGAIDGVLNCVPGRFSIMSRLRSKKANNASQQAKARSRNGRSSSPLPTWLIIVVQVLMTL